MFGSSFQVVFGNIFISKQCLERTFKYYYLYISSYNFLSDVSYFYSHKRSKNLAMLENKITIAKSLCNELFRKVLVWNIFLNWFVVMSEMSHSQEKIKNYSCSLLLLLQKNNLPVWSMISQTFFFNSFTLFHYNYLKTIFKLNYYQSRSSFMLIFLKQLI